MTADITIVGLGPGPAELRTLAAQQALDDAQHIYVRIHPDVDLSDLLQKPNVTNLERYHDMSAPNRWIRAAETVLEGAQQGPVVLAVPGHPRFGEGLVMLTLELASERNVTTTVIDGVSAVDMIASALDIDPILDRVQMVSCRKLLSANDRAPFDGGKLNLSPRLPIIITHAYTQELLTAAQQQLERIYPSDHPVTFITAAGLPQEQRLGITVDELSNHQGSGLLAVYVPPLGELDATRTPATLQHIVARLRREDGCPWDREQTNATLSASLVDEVYEIVDAIDARDDANLAEELGDMLMLILMHAQIAEERGAFRLEDVYDGIVTKIVRRHSHVFGDAAASNAEEVIGLWNQIKAQEQTEGRSKPTKAADGQPHSMPAMERAVRVLKKHPVKTISSSSNQREQALLQAVAAIVAAGDNPATILETALENHVSGNETSLD